MLKTSTVGGDNLIIEFPEATHAVASTVMGGGYSRLTHVVFHRVGEDFDDPNPKKYAANLVERLGLPVETTAVFLTAVDVVKEYIARSIGEVYLVATIGFRPLACIDTANSPRPSTINILVYSNKPLHVNALVDLVSTVSSAKTLALVDLALSCSGSVSRAYATVTDAIVVSSPLPSREGELFAGPATPIGATTAKLVYESLVLHGLSKIGVDERVKHILGVDIEWLVDTALKFYEKAPIPGKPLNEIRLAVKHEVEKLLEDPNVWAILMSARSLDYYGIAGAIPMLSREEYKNDSKRIVADELLGIMLSIYINGWKALFSYYWVDRLKDRLGEFKDKPMFIDDALASLIGSILSRVYDKYLGGSSE